jgi:spore coat polysaccharide biosynthesis protein SpsF
VTCAEVVDLAVQTFRATGCDYLSNLMVQTYPQAVDARVFRADDLEEIDRELAGQDTALREHPYLYFEEHGERYRLVNLYASAQHRRPQWRLDLDYAEDLELLRVLFGDLYPQNPQFSLDDLVAYLDSHQELMSINQNMERKPLRP